MNLSKQAASLQLDIVEARAVAPLAAKGKDLRGERFGRLVVVELVGRTTNRRLVWSAVCDCGNSIEVAGTYLLSGESRSCGCLQRDIARRAGDRTRTHSLSRTSTYSIWDSMRARCNNPQRTDYPRYGGRGIKVCERWNTSFDSFLADMGVRPPGMSLDRFPNQDGNYEPGNCRWATVRQQARNHSGNRLITANGVTRCLIEWSEVTGLRCKTITDRLARGWTADDAINKPIDQRCVWRLKK